MPGIFFLILFLSQELRAQQFDWPAIIFEDSSNFRILRSFDDKFPKKYIVISESLQWGPERFKLDESSEDSTVRAKIARSEHHLYNSYYIFRDTQLNKLISPAEKQYLFDQASTQNSRAMPVNKSKYRLIKSYETAPPGFFFHVSSPIYSTDKNIAYVDVCIYKKTKYTSGFLDSSFATLLLIYKYSPESDHWSLLKKIGYLIL